MKTETKVTHTPTPWIAVPQGDGSSMLAREYETGTQLNPKGLRLIAHVMARGSSLPEDEANAAFIVRAVNAYERHAKALMRVMAINGSTGGNASLVKEFKAIAAQALDSYDVEAIAKAEGA